MDSTEKGSARAGQIVGVRTVIAKLPPAHRCIAKVTNFMVTIACYRDPLGTFIIAAEILDETTFGKTITICSKSRYMRMTIREFNDTAKRFGFRKKISVKDFKTEEKE
jgi:hypothetical protein